MIRPRDLFRRKGTAPKEAREKKDSLERSLDSLAKWLEFFTAIVVVGLVVEYTPDVISAIRDHILHPHIIGGILITIGVAGELLIGFRASRVDNELREINNSTIAAAHERVAVLEAEIEQEQQRTAEAQKAAAEAQKELAENLSTFALRSGDRVLNFQKFVDGLKKSPTLTVEAWCVPNSDEAERFSTEIVRALQHVE